MTNPLQAVTLKDERYYPYEGKRYRSVTTHIGNLPKPFLVPWAAREVARFALQFIEGGKAVTQDGEIVDAKRCSDPLSGEELEKYLKTEWQRQRDTAGDLGTAVHGHAETILLSYFDAPDGADPVEHMRNFAQGYVDELRANLGKESREYRRTSHVVDWLHEYRVEPLFVEPTVFAPSKGYAGSCDLFATIDGIPTVMDFKTSKSLYPDVALQLAAYAHGDFIRLDDGEEYEVPGIERGAALHITDKGYRFREVDIFATTADGKSVMDIFLSLVHIGDWWLRDLSKDVLGKDVKRGGAYE